jgi:hypothetical protein
MKRLFFAMLAVVLTQATPASASLGQPGSSGAPPALSQQRDFLTGGESDAIREAQEPAERLKLYVDFAKRRIDTIAKLLQSKEADRGDQMHDALYEYDRILDAIGKNVDRAEQRRDIFKKGLQYALEQEPLFLKQLEAVRAANPADLEQYKFILDQAIDNTHDDVDELAVVLKKQPTNRKEEKDAKAAAEKAAKDRERAAQSGSSTGQKSTDPANRPGWNPNAGPPTRKKTADPQQPPPDQPPATPPATKKAPDPPPPQP